MASKAERESSRYVALVVVGLGALLVMWIVRNMVVRFLHPDVAWTAVVSLLPVLPIAAIVWLMRRAVRESDELARRIFFESLGGAVAVGVIAMYAYGALSDAGVVPLVSFTDAMVPFAILWAGISFLVGRRYNAVRGE